MYKNLVENFKKELMFSFLLLLLFLERHNN